MRVLSILLSLCVCYAAGINLGTVDYEPTKKLAQQQVKGWERLFLEQDLKPLASMWTKDIKFCLAGECHTGTEWMKPFYAKKYTKFECTASEGIYQKNHYIHKWSDDIIFGTCNLKIDGYLVAYLNDEGKIKEIHDFLDMKVFSRLLSEECAGEAGQKDEL